MKVNKTILKHRNYIIEEMLKGNKDIEDVLIQCNFAKKRLIENELIESSKIVDELILELKKGNRNDNIIENILDRLDNSIDMKL